MIGSGTEGDLLGESLNSHLRSLPDGSLTRAEVGVLCNEIERQGALRRAYKDAWSALEGAIEDALVSLDPESEEAQELRQASDQVRGKLEEHRG